MVDPWHIRDADSGDAIPMRQIEGRCFSDPWSDRDFEEMLASSGVIAFVAEWPEGLGGYLVARRVGGTAEILNLAVPPERRRQGLAATLLERLMAQLFEEGVERVFLEVRRSNLAAQELYRRFGFALVGVRRSYYRKPSEDALVLASHTAVDAPKGSIQPRFD